MYVLGSERLCWHFYRMKKHSNWKENILPTQSVSIVVSQKCTLSSWWLWLFKRFRARQNDLLCGWIDWHFSEFQLNIFRVTGVIITKWSLLNKIVYLYFVGQNEFINIRCGSWIWRSGVLWTVKHHVDYVIWMQHSSLHGVLEFSYHNVVVEIVFLETAHHVVFI